MALAQIPIEDVCCLPSRLIWRDDGSIPNGRAADLTPTATGKLVAGTRLPVYWIRRRHTANAAYEFRCRGLLKLPQAPAETRTAADRSWSPHLRVGQPVCQLLCTPAMARSGPYVTSCSTATCATTVARGPRSGCGAKRRERIGILLTDFGPIARQGQELARGKFPVESAPGAKSRHCSIAWRGSFCENQHCSAS
jgi:hypothetical protein